MSKCPPKAVNLGADVLSLYKQARDNVDNSVIRQQADAPPIDLSSGSPFLDIPIDLAAVNTAGNAGVPVSSFNGQKVIYRKEGSTPGGRLNFISAGRVTRLYPGCYFDAPVTGGTLQIATNSVASGTALFTIIKSKGYDFFEPPYGLSPPILLPGAGPGSVGPAGVATQAYNSAAGNIPTAATDGLSLAGVTGVRANIVSAVGSTISAAELHWWQFDTVSQLWGETDMLDIYALSAVNRVWFPLDKQVWVPEGRIYAELRSATNSAGSGAFTVHMQTFGNG